MGVAVCDTPAGAYQFYGKVHFPDGHVWGKRSGEPFPFDPGVLVDEDEKSLSVYRDLLQQFRELLPGRQRPTNPGGCGAGTGTGYGDDSRRHLPLLSSRSEPYGAGSGSFEGHAFFEAPLYPQSRCQLYCFRVFAQWRNHELCYAFADTPKGPFTYGGTLIDLGDLLS